MEKGVLHWSKTTILKVTQLYRFLLQLQFENLVVFSFKFSIILPSRKEKVHDII